MQYDAALSRFPERYICRLGCTGYATDVKIRPDLPGAALIVLTLNGVREVYVPKIVASLGFTNFYTDSLSLGVDAPLYQTPGGAQVNLLYGSSVQFGATLSPVNDPVNTPPSPFTNPMPNYIALSAAGGVENISFTIDKTRR